MPKPPSKKQNNFQSRPPVVVILGHVDHGKSTLIERIKDIKITEKEAGGITQHIGAYQIEHQSKSITLLDTPGHEAFSAMRSRGAKVADMAVLIVAAEEGVKPQTKEAIKHIKRTGLPLIVAINKIDKKEAQPEKVKRELKEADIIVESLGGQTPSVNVSAKTGQGINELLEMINLVAEMEELKSEPNKSASGVVIESRLDSLRGPTATLLVKDGTLKNTDIIGADSAFGRVKTMEDFRGRSIQTAFPSAPVIVTGFNQTPQIGEKFNVFENIETAQKKTEKNSAKRKEDKEVFLITDDKKVLNIILKADVRGSLEAIRGSFQAIPQEEVILRLLKAEVGKVTESDIKLAQIGQAKIIGFRVKTDSKIQQMAEQKKIKILTFEVIYELIQKTRELLAGLLAPEIIKNVLGQMKILAIFPAKKGRQIIGGKVISGQIKRGALIEVMRNNQRIDKGRLLQLQHNKKDVEEVTKGQEGGIMFEGQTVIEKGDILEIYEEERKKREL